MPKFKFCEEHRQTFLLGVQTLWLCAIGGKTEFKLLNNNLYIVIVHSLSLFLTGNF